jgi:hypothetical protein
MPRRLLDRCQPDSIREFRLAARRRYHDALALAAAGQRTGAIYLWGYAAEMVVKAAYFSAIQLPETTPVTWQGHIKPAIATGKSLNILWPASGQGHNVRAWAELLILERAKSVSTAYPASFRRELQRRGQLLEQLWRETLRYHKNVAYRYEMKQVRDAVEWLLVHSRRL